MLNTKRISGLCHSMTDTSASPRSRDREGKMRGRRDQTYSFIIRCSNYMNYMNPF